MLAEVIATLRMLVEINLFALVGQGVLYVLPGVDRQTNLFYLILKTIASPAMRLARWISPRFVVDRHVGWVALFICLLLWTGLAIVRQLVAALEAG
ncbi:MAG: hypothetical protein A3I63_08510 [Betaproteobacteria bacterium RIFCSPLOWO2_02_FULL_66_14]|nr:MAG: hypothetical protein A3I63_08510 [Betaproteobacteria bacterium RIFCSPLOWO2_02_FULL_66_14]